MVLGGGGVTGVAWQVGLLLGWQRAGLNVRAADTIVGTSAGSIVGALLALSADLEALAQEQLADVTSEAPIEADMPTVMQAFMVLFDPSRAPKEARQIVGKMALDAAVGDEARYLRRFANRFVDQRWPSEPRLRLTGVDAHSGESIEWDHRSSVPLHLAVAASCAVPCVFPPVTIGERRYMDGGIRSAVNADLAAGASRVVVVAPMLQFSPRWPREREKLGAAELLVVAPDAGATEAIGPNVMDLARRSAAFEAGLAQASTLLDAAQRLLL